VATDSHVLVEDTCLQNVVERTRRHRPANNAQQHVNTDANHMLVIEYTCICSRYCVT